MESLLRAVGLGSGGDWQQEWHARRVSSRRTHSVDDTSATTPGSADIADVGLLPDLAQIAAATERGILALEDEARTLERCQLQEALVLCRRWAHGVRRKPRPDESLASFRAQFLRSNALEKALEAVRRNRLLYSALVDPPLFASGAGVGERRSSPQEELLAELRGLIQMCLPKAAASLAAPVLKAVLEPSEQSFAASLTAFRALKEDWQEVVRSQTLRGLERRLDFLAYELQKRPPAPRSAGGQAPLSFNGSRPQQVAKAGRRASHDRVTVLAMLCEGIQQSLQSLKSLSMSRTEVHAAEGGVFAETVATTPVSRASPAARAMGEGGDESLPSLSDCQEAVAAMVTKTEQGMRSGLRLLGLPDSPLHFMPDLELRLCGHDIRVAVRTMIEHWLEEETEEFFDVLLRIRRIVDQPAAPDDQEWTEVEQKSQEQVDKLLNERAALHEERQALLSRLQELDHRLGDLDIELTQLDSGTASASGQGRTPRKSSVAVRCALGDAGSCPLEGLGPSLESAISQHIRGHQGSFTCASPTASAVSAMPRTDSVKSTSSQQLSPELSSLVESAVEALAGETQRSAERLATQLQNRRVQLLGSLSSHLQGETDQLTSLAYHAHTGERLEAMLHEARELISRVEAVTGCQGHPGLDTENLISGTRCRAKWLDGNFYDATIQSVLGDGTVVVNWLRPRPVSSSDGSPTRRPLVTISDTGGDDTLHRIVSKADVQLAGSESPGPFSSPGDGQAAALRLFEARSPEDMACADCSADGADWASVSFGIYLCRKCAAEHQHLGVRLSLVRQLNDGWGWVQRDLQYLSRGGNAAFHECLSRYPALRSSPISERYASRFAEYYRRHLDSLCTGAQLPQLPPSEQAAHPSSGEFLSAAEAAAVAQELARRFEAAVQSAAQQARLAGGAMPVAHARPISAQSAMGNRQQYHGLQKATPSTGRLSKMIAC